MGFVLPTTGVTADGVAYTKAWVLNWSKVANAAWFEIPKFMPIKPVFDMRAILPVMIMFIVTAVETVGDISGVMEGGLGREATDKELSGGVICDGVMGLGGFAANSVMLVVTSGLVGFKFALMTKLTGNLYMAMGDHFLNNTIVNVLHVISDAGADQMQVVRIAVAQSVSFAIVLAWYLMKKRRSDSNGI